MSVYPGQSLREVPGDDYEDLDFEEHDHNGDEDFQEYEEDSEDYSDSDEESDGEDQGYSH